MDNNNLAQLLKQAQNNEANYQYEDAAVQYEEIISNTTANPPMKNKEKSV